MTQDQQSEPPSVLRPPLFMVGQDTRGNWVVQDQKGIRGGLFVNREAALRYVRSENGFKPQAVVMVSGGIELDMNRNAGAVLRVSANRRRIAWGPMSSTGRHVSRLSGYAQRCRHHSMMRDVSTPSRSSGYAICKSLMERQR